MFFKSINLPFLIFSNLSKYSLFDMVDNSESCCKTGTGKCDESESHNESESKSSGCCKSGSNSSSCGDSGCTGSGCSGSDASLKKYLPYIVGIALAVFLLIGIGIAVLGYGSDQ